MLHVCLISEAHTVHARRWAIGLHEAGVRVTLCSPVPAEKSFPFDVIHMPLYSASLAKCWKNLRQAILLLRSLSPDIVHLHGLFALQSPRVMWLASCLPAPLLVSTWGSDVDPFEGGSGLLARYVRRYLLGRAERITATGRFLAQRTKQFSPPGKEIDIVPFGVEADADIAPRSLSPPYVIGFFKGHSPIYGADVLLRAAALLRQKGRDDFRLEMIGRSEQAEGLMRLAGTLEIDDITDWVDFLPRPELLERIRGMYVTVVPSRKESFGVAALESQLFGVPVVAANVGGLPETLVDGVTGLLFPSEDIQALANALGSLLERPEQRREMGKAGRNFVLQHYAWQACVQRMVAIYDEVASGNRADSQGGTGRAVPDNGEAE